MSADSAAKCPFTSTRDDSKSASVVAQRLKIEPGAERVRAYDRAREILLSKELLQAGAGAEYVDTSDPDKSPVFFLDGAPHREKRTGIARFFTPKAITSRYHAIIERETSRLLAQLRRDGRAQLDVISFELTVAVAANIVGLTDSDIPRMARRLAVMLSAGRHHRQSLFARLSAGLRKGQAMLSFYAHDITPALRVRRQSPQDDLLSELLAKGASRRAILTECMTYAAAGMVTTREFIVMAAWHLFDRPELRADFLAGDEARQFAILNEILRLEPIASLLYRRKADQPDARAEKYALDLRAIHEDEAAVGPCPRALDPDRAERLNTNGAFLSFGAGAHHCPGKQVALHETRMFLDALLRVPGVRLERAPDVGWSEMLLSYELRNAVVTCDRA
ncbi:cytochrome P450 [Nannocystis punicea]|uniref:Cytochrome P450 n=1 Tax=Nannocystis punicea TaxID=2995304 RepID=A0ABY7GSS1_9BACT|nr:cytochrome P450 [Nannocystis poenicansa]WAS89974.1 cytochrome P450 [Nannocystis poenicansa]